MVSRPAQATAACPEVRIVSTPSSKAVSSASKGSRHTSKARWRVMRMSPAAAIISPMAARSRVPSDRRAPMTTALAPWAAKVSISRHMTARSAAV